MAFYNRLINKDNSLWTKVALREDDDITFLDESIMTLSMDPAPTGFGLSFIKRSQFQTAPDGTLYCKSVSVEKFDLLDFDPERMKAKAKKAKEKYLVNSMYARFLTFVQMNFQMIMKCKYFLVEKPDPVNYDLTCFMNVIVGILMAYVQNSPEKPSIYILDPKFAKNMFGEKMGGGNGANKKWAEEQGEQLLRFRGEVAVANALIRLKRYHDIMDSIVQEEAFMKHMGLPISVELKEEVLDLSMLDSMPSYTVPQMPQSDTILL